MKSMTGYAYCKNMKDETTVSVEIKGYNSRFLDLQIFLPSWLSSLESLIREYIASRFIRGKIDINIRLKEHNSDISVSVNKAAAKAYYTAIKELSMGLGIKKKPDLSMVLGLEGVFETEKKIKDSEKYWSYINPVLAEAADKFEAERLREGKHTLDDILSHLKIIEDNAGIISEKTPEMESLIKENLRTRFTEVLGSQIDEARVLS